MKLTAKQELFISEYMKDLNATEISIEYVIKGLICLYLKSEKSSDKKYSAWLIKRIRPNIKLIGIEKLLDMEVLNQLAREKQEDIDKLARFAQKRRHERRKDFALTDNEWIEAVEYFENECAYCGDKEKKLTYDHYIPFSKGGSFTADNIIPCCKKCNSSKKDNDFMVWYKKQFFYDENKYIKVINYISDRK